MLKVVLLGVVLLWPSWASAFTYYVDKDTTRTPGASNSNSCVTARALSTPKLTITGASGGLTCLAAGDTLLIRGGNYNEFIENGYSGTSIASGTSWSAPTRIAAYPNGCSPTAPNPCGTAGETVWVRPANATTVGNAMTLGYDAGLQYVEFDGINLSGQDASPGEIFGEFGLVCYDGSLGNPNWGSNYIRYKNAEMIGAPGDPSISNTGGAHIASFATITTVPSSACPGGHEFLNLYIHGGGDNEVGWTPGRRYTAYAYYLTTSNTLIEQNLIVDTRYFGVQANCDGCVTGYATGLIVRNNVIHDISRGSSSDGQGVTDAILVGDGYDGAVVYNNVIYHTGNPNSVGSSGIRCYDGATNIKIYNNTVYQSVAGSVGIQTTAGCSGATIRNNISYLNAGGDYVSNGAATTASNNLFGTNPLFVDAGGADFHLDSNSSPAFDTGFDLGVGSCPNNPCYNRDVDNVLRPQYGGWDIGAYEYTTATGDPATPSGFVPADTATGVSTAPTLSWDTSTNATSYNVYFGTYSGVGSSAASDAFTRANSGTLGASWTESYTGTVTSQIVSNAVEPTSIDFDSVSVHTQALEPNQWSQMTLNTWTGASILAARILLRMQVAPTFSGYDIGAIANFGTYTTWIARIDAGTETILTYDTTTSWAATDVLLATMVGKTITVYRNGSPILTTTDATYTTGKAGMMLYTSGSFANLVVDSWSAGNMGPLYVQNQAGLTYAPGALSASTTYYWKIAGVNSVTYTDGPIISFTTSGGVPSCTSGYSPIDTATGVTVTPTLSWSSAATATSYDVYFDAVDGSTLVSSAQAGLTYAPSTLANSTQYFWKIVPRNASGPAVGCTAVSFTTVAAAAAGSGGNRLRRK